MGGALGYIAKIISGLDGVWWLLIGVITGALSRTIDSEWTRLKDKNS